LDSPAHLEFWLALFQIISINLVLSGDNAAVIALAARELHGRQRHQAIIIGSLGAVVLRVLLTVAAVQLLTIPYLQTVGSILLLWVAARLVRPHGQKALDAKDNSATLQEAVRAIVIADVVMSFDNVLSLAAVARGSWVLLIIGLLTSIPLIMVGSTVLMKLMTRYPVIITLGAGLLGYVAGDMLLSDPLWQHSDVLRNAWIHNGIPVLLALGVILLGSDPNRGYFLGEAAAGLRLVMRPLSVPAVSSIMALIKVGLRDAMASSIPLRNWAGVVAYTPTPPKASINFS